MNPLLLKNAVVLTLLSTIATVSPLEASQKDPVKSGIQYSGPSAIAPVVRQVSYRAAPSRSMVVVTPSHSAGRVPLVLLLHGTVADFARPRPTDWEFFLSYARALASQGLAAVIVDHRLGWPDPLIALADDDIAQVFSYLTKHGGGLGLDADRIGIVAFSAGGPLLPPAVRHGGKRIRCIAGMYANLDPATMPSYRRYLTEPVLRAHALQAILGDAYRPPLFIAKGDRDQIEGVNSSIDAFEAAAKRSSYPFRLVSHPTGVHSFDIENIDPKTTEILDSLFKFLRLHLMR